MKIGATLRYSPLDQVARWFGRFLPKGLYARALIIIIAPVILLQSVVAYVFMERHYQLVTRRLSSAVTADISALIDIYESYPQDKDASTLSRIASERLQLDVDILRNTDLPPPGPKPFFDILDETLTDELRRQIDRPYWIDTVGRSSYVEIRIKLNQNDVMRVLARRSQAYASNSHIFLVWMGGSSFVLLGIAILFLRNQIRPILRLAEAAEALGKGREIEFRPRGAREVRQAGHAFLEMKRRIERNIEQRTTMLNGVSHDLRTILTRFKLSLVFLDQTPEVEDLKRDVDEMSRMLEGYLAFARGDGGDAGEQAVATDLRQLLEEAQSDAERQGHVTELDIIGDPMITVRPDAFRRLLFNLVGNAARHGDRIEITANHETRWLVLHVDDDGPGIPPGMREEVFKPFVRLDEARNQDEGGSGLGLAIARDVARSHGGDIVLGESPLGGLRATVRLPA
ncbi:ATP-binding protein [Microvirga sp. Mcv34]|uniref:ATP-binding protein n=1 Tax=Microvirga sp. Mcv34 TaxID=2926016 RepID=UPI0021C9FF95|nr:ATP-binding protein [Microvirga sp. Mcv34]